MNRTALAAALVVACSVAHAAEPLEITVQPQASYTFDADAGDVSLSVFRVGPVVTLECKPSEALTLSLRGEAEYSRYNTDGLDAADATGDYVRYNVRPTVTLFLSQSFGLFAGGYVENGGETGASLSNAYLYGGYAGANYKLAEGVWIGGGVGYETQLEDTPYFYPLINAYWQITPQLMLTADGVGGRLSYKFDDTWTAFLDARFESREYRIGDGPLENGVLSDEGVPVLLGVKYSIGEDFEATLAGGAVVLRQVSLTDGAGNDVVDESADPTGIATASLQWKF
ncbi:MAG TPA: hypothetical protein VF624_17295 [Tepidisphaeraceae bacterium]